MKYFSVVSLALLSVWFTKSNAQSLIAAKPVDMIIVEIYTANLSATDEAFYKNFLADEMARVMSDTNTTRRLDGSSRNLRGGRGGQDGGEGGEDELSEEQRRRLLTCYQCQRKPGYTLTMCEAQGYCRRRALGLPVTDEEIQRELDLFADVDMNDYDCMILGAEGRRNMNLVAKGLTSRPAHNFTSTDAKPANAQEFFCTLKPGAAP
jgi:hypothetical protein